MATETTGLEWEETQIDGKSFWVTESGELGLSIGVSGNEYVWEMWCFCCNNKLDDGSEPTLEAAKAAVERIVGQDQPGGAG